MSYVLHESEGAGSVPRRRIFPNVPFCSSFLFRSAAAFYAVPQQLSMPCRSSFLCRAVAISARGLSVFRAVGLNVFRVAGILVFIPRSSLIFCSVQQLSVPCSSFLFRAAVFCSVQLFSVPCSCFLCRAVVFRFVLMGHRTIVSFPFCSASVSIILVLIFPHCSPQLCTPKSLEGGMPINFAGSSVVAIFTMSICMGLSCWSTGSGISVEPTGLSAISDPPVHSWITSYTGPPGRV